MKTAMLAALSLGLACRGNQPVNDPKPEPNSPLPRIQRADVERSSPKGGTKGTSADEGSGTPDIQDGGGGTR